MKYSFPAPAGSSSIVSIAAWRPSPTVVWVEYYEVRQDVLLKIAAIIEARGAKIAIPSRTLYLESPAEAPAAGRK